MRSVQLPGSQRSAFPSPSIDWFGELDYKNLHTFSRD